MSSRAITAVAFKLFAIYLCVQLVLYVPGLFASFRHLGGWVHGKYIPYIISLATIVLGFVFAYIIWRLGKSSLDNLPKDDQGYSKNFEVVVLQVFGLYLVVSSLKYLPVNTINVFFSDLYMPGQIGLVAERITVIMHYVVLFLGMHLILKANGWSALLAKIRSLGQ